MHGVLIGMTEWDVDAWLAAASFGPIAIVVGCIAAARSKSRYGPYFFSLTVSIAVVVWAFFLHDRARYQTVTAYQAWRRLSNAEQWHYRRESTLCTAVSIPLGLCGVWVTLYVRQARGRSARAVLITPGAVCPVCHYDVSALSTSPVCPECGAPILHRKAGGAPGGNPSA